VTQFVDLREKGTLYPLSFLKIQLCQSLGKGVVDGFLRLFFLFIQVFLDFFFADAGAFFFPALFEAG